MLHSNNSDDYFDNGKQSCLHYAIQIWHTKSGGLPLGRTRPGTASGSNVLTMLVRTCLPNAVGVCQKANVWKRGGTPVINREVSRSGELASSERVQKDLAFAKVFGERSALMGARQI